MNEILSTIHITVSQAQIIIVGAVIAVAIKQAWNTWNTLTGK